MDLLFPRIELNVVFGVAGWVTYLQKGAQAGGRAGAETKDDDEEKGAQAGGGAGAETEDDEEGSMPARPVTPTAQLWTTQRFRCRDGTGTYVRLTAAAFAGLQCECAVACCGWAAIWNENQT